MAKGAPRSGGQHGRSLVLPIVLAGLLGIGGGGALVMGAARSVPGADAGDWLAFSGALLGVMLTVAAAVWIEDRKRAAEESAQVGLVYDALENLRVAFERLDEPLPVSDTFEVLRIVSILEHILEAMETLTFMHQHARVADVLVWRQIREIEREIASTLSQVSSLPSTAARVTLPIEELRIHHSTSKLVASVVRPLLLQAMDQLKPRR